MIALRRAALALLVLLAWLAPASGAERILRFVSDVNVLQNGDLQVTETIRIEAEGDQFKHGILRDFPTIYTRRDGTRVRVGFDVQSVTRDGDREPFTTERKGNGVEVRIGDPDRMLSFGPHEFVIRYLTTRQLGFFADYDKLYWECHRHRLGFLDRPGRSADHAARGGRVPAQCCLYGAARRHRHGC